MRHEIPIPAAIAGEGTVAERVSIGVIYVVWGADYLAEAIASATSVLKHGNVYGCALITDHEPAGEHPFSHVLIRKFSGTYRDKIMMAESPFERTIFLDSDTAVLGSLDQVFRLLDRFDVAFQAAHGGLHYALPGVPMEAFPEPSAGIVAWRKNDRTDDFFRSWDRAYTAQELANGPGAWDQRSLRQALWDSDISLTMLPGVWQLISFDVGICLGKVKMIHGRGSGAAIARTQCNDHPGHRIYIPRLGFYSMYKTSPRDYLRLATNAFRMFVLRSARLLLHHIGVWRLPQNRRPM